jgi:hypothetical protein
MGSKQSSLTLNYIHWTVNVMTSLLALLSAILYVHHYMKPFYVKHSLRG